MTDGYTERAVRIIEEAHVRWGRCPNGVTLWEAMIAALANAGMLLPEPTERRIEYGVWWHLANSDGIAYSDGAIGSVERAHEIGRERIGTLGLVRYTVCQSEHRVFADGSTWIGPWVPVTAAEEANHG